MRFEKRAIFAALLILVTNASGAETDRDFAGWPENWANTYRHFEKFIAAQYANVPTTDLTLSPRGEVQTDLPGEIDPQRFPQRHTTIAFYKNGAEILEMQLKGGLFSEGRNRLFPPGTYATCLVTCDELAGYQFRHPLRWLQVNHARFGMENDIQTEGPLAVQMIAQPEPGGDFWPNDRLLRFRDFQVLPHYNPLQSFRENRRVSPNVTLAVSNSGTIQRDKLDAALEKLLRWRIYHNGRLVENGWATDDIRHAAVRGMGTYVAFVGVDGPTGFMPVSNLLQFPLFPERNGSLAVCPSTTQEAGVPDCLFDALDPEQMNRLRRSIGWRARRDPYDASTIYCLNDIGEVSDPEKQAVISLWSAWGWSVNLAKANPVSEIGRIRMVVAGK